MDRREDFGQRRGRTDVHGHHGAVGQHDVEVGTRDGVHAGAVVQRRQRHGRCQSGHVDGDARGAAEAQAAVERIDIGVEVQPGECRDVDRVRTHAAGQFGVLEARDRVDHAAGRQGRVRQREIEVAGLDQGVEADAGVDRVGAGAAGDAVVAGAAAQAVRAGAADQHVVAHTAAQHHGAREARCVEQVGSVRAVDLGSLDVRQQIQQGHALRGHDCTDAAARQVDRRGCDVRLLAPALLADEGDDPGAAEGRLAHEHVALVHGLEPRQGALHIPDVGVPRDRVGGLAGEVQLEGAARHSAAERDRDDFVGAFGEVERRTRGGADEQRARAELDRRVDPGAAVEHVAPCAARQEVVARAALQYVVTGAAVERDRAEREGRRVERVGADAAGEPRLLDTGKRCHIAGAVGQRRVGEREVGVARRDEQVDAQAAHDAVVAATADERVFAGAARQRVVVAPPVEAGQPTADEAGAGDLAGGARRQQAEVGRREGAVQRLGREGRCAARGVEQFEAGPQRIDARREALVLAIEQVHDLAQRRQFAQVEFELCPVGQGHAQVGRHVGERETTQHGRTAFAQDAEVRRGERAVQGRHRQVAAQDLRVAQRQCIATAGIDHHAEPPRGRGVGRAQHRGDRLLHGRLPVQIDIDRRAIGQRDAEVSDSGGVAAHAVALVQAREQRRAQQIELLQVGSSQAGAVVEQREQDVGAAVERHAAAGHGDAVQLRCQADHGQAQVRGQRGGRERLDGATGSRRIDDVDAVAIGVERRGQA